MPTTRRAAPPPSHKPAGRRAVVGLLLLASLPFLSPTGFAQGRIIIVEPPEERRPPPHMPPIRPPGPGQLLMTLHALKVNAAITDGIAVTTVEQSFQNPCGRNVEGTYIFPLPDRAAVTADSLAFSCSEALR